jgi:hypothetical protein
MKLGGMPLSPISAASGYARPALGDNVTEAMNELAAGLRETARLAIS